MSSKRNHEWVPGESPPLIRPHSLAKHRVIQSYLSRYVEVLTKNPKQPRLCLTLVDGFAGGGIYRDSETHEVRDGSPLLMLQAMKSAAKQAQELRSKEFSLDVEYFFIEKNKNAFEYLTKTIQESEFNPLISKQVTLIRGEFEAQVERIVQRVQERGHGRRVIFVLDQMGYIQATFPVIRGILTRLDNAEIILTFATDSLIDYLSNRPATQQILEKTGLSLSADHLVTLKQQAEARRFIQMELHQEIHRQSGAAHYTPFFIRSKDAHRDYWLVHLSGHAKARDVMVGLHWQENNSFAHYGRPGLDMLGYDPDLDVSLTGRPALPMFCFDETAKSLCSNSLIEQIPERISLHRDGITFKEFFSNVTNETPATSELMKEAVEQLCAEGQLKVFDHTGKRRRSGVRHATDVLRWNPQKRLFLPEGSG